MINYKIINDSIDFYEKRGFKRIESPWTVTAETANITKPNDCDSFTIKEKDKVLVASGEQSFLYLYLKGFLPKGRFQTVTPCFRNDSFDSLHTKYFIKNELIITDVIDKWCLFFMIDDAKVFFESKLGIDTVKKIQTSTSSYDLIFEGIELGSYGIRKCDFLSWIYGTGVAEPRLSRIMQKYGIS